MKKMKILWTSLKQPLWNFIYSQHLKYIGHICRTESTILTKILLLVNP